jgi:hypothetical protein
VEIDNNMVVAHRGSAGDERIWGAEWHNLFTPPSWSAPQVIGDGAFNSTHAPSLCSVAGHSLMAWKGSGTDERIFIADLSGGIAVHNPVPAVEGPNGAFLTIDRPAIAMDGSGGVILAWRAPDNTLLWSSRASGRSWDAPRAFGATTGHGPVLALSGGKFFLIWTEVDNGKLWWAEHTGTGWQSIAPVPVAAGAALTSDTPAVAAHQGGIILAWKGIADQNVWFMSPGGTPGIVTPSNGAVLTDHGPALGITNDPSTAGAVIRLVWKGVTGDQHLWWSSRFPPSGAWTTPAFLNAGANSAAGPAMVTSRRDAFDDGTALQPVDE